MCLGTILRNANAHSAWKLLAKAATCSIRPGPNNSERLDPGSSPTHAVATRTGAPLILILKWSVKFLRMSFGSAARAGAKGHRAEMGFVTPAAFAARSFLVASEERFDMARRGSEARNGYCGTIVLLSSASTVLHEREDCDTLTREDVEKLSDNPGANKPEGSERRRHDCTGKRETTVHAIQRRRHAQSLQVHKHPPEGGRARNEDLREPAADFKCTH
jgi:hypothetical protein